MLMEYATLTCVIESTTGYGSKHGITHSLQTVNVGDILGSGYECWLFNHCDSRNATSLVCWLMQLSLSQLSRLVKQDSVLCMGGAMLASKLKQTGQRLLTAHMPCQSFSTPLCGRSTSTGPNVASACSGWKQCPRLSRQQQKATHLSVAMRSVLPSGDDIKWPR